MRTVLAATTLLLGLTLAGRSASPVAAQAAQQPAASWVQTAPAAIMLRGLGHAREGDGAENAIQASGTRAELQSISQDQLKAALPVESDLPGYTQLIDNQFQLPGPDANEAVQGVVRAFASATGDALAFELVGVPTESAGDFSTATAAASILDSAARTSGARVADFAMAGALGVGDDDQAATWESYNTGAQRWVAASGEVFLRGDVLAVVLYLGRPSAVNLGALSTFAQLQDTLVVAANFP